MCVSSQQQTLCLSLSLSVHVSGSECGSVVALQVTEPTSEVPDNIRPNHLIKELTKEIRYVEVRQEEEEEGEAALMLVLNIRVSLSHFVYWHFHLASQ